MKRKNIAVILAGIFAIAVLGGCGSADTNDSTNLDTAVSDSSKTTDRAGEEITTIDSSMLTKETKIELSDSQITIDGEPVSTDSSAAIYTANDIVYYMDGQDFTYGEGSDSDAHSQEEAAAHTVVHITQSGTYRISGLLSAGQIAVDLGENASDNPDAVVNLILDNADITCSVAPAVIFYNVYENGSDDEENATKDVDTEASGANVILADGSENNINGSYVAKIYKSVELSDDGTEVEDSEKLHKYDGAFYSKMSMNIYSETEGTGTLNILGENEGLCSELHLTINGGNINIESGNDGINTNEDYVSVTTINGGNLNITINGDTGEGDGIDSNGWLIINGGSVTCAACSISGDAGIDSDMGIHINGGSVIATGNMLDQIAESAQTYAVFQFNDSQKGGTTYTLKNADTTLGEWTPVNDFTYLIISSPDLTKGTYTFWRGEEQLSGSASIGMNMGGSKMPGNRERPELPEDMEIPKDGQMPGNGERPELPEDMEFPEDGQMPGNGERPELPEDMEIQEGGQVPGGRPGMSVHGQMAVSEASTEFTIMEGANYFIIQ